MSTSRGTCTPTARARPPARTRATCAAHAPPGSFEPPARTARTACEASAAPHARARPLACAQNEFLIDGEAWARKLPAAIEAFIEATNPRGASARPVHERFVQRFGAMTVPLLCPTANTDAPFVEAPRVDHLHRDRPLHCPR